MTLIFLRIKYNYLFRFFLIRFSMNMLLSLKRKVTKETFAFSSAFAFRFGIALSRWWR